MEKCCIKFGEIQTNSMKVAFNQIEMDGLVLINFGLECVCLQSIYLQNTHVQVTANISTRTNIVKQ